MVPPLACFVRHNRLEEEKDREGIVKKSQNGGSAMEFENRSVRAVIVVPEAAVGRAIINSSYRPPHEDGRVHVIPFQ